jgi:hypothetical protein
MRQRSLAEWLLPVDGLRGILSANRKKTDIRIERISFGYHEHLLISSAGRFRAGGVRLERNEKARVKRWNHGTSSASVRRHFAGNPVFPRLQRGPGALSAFSVRL